MKKIVYYPSNHDASEAQISERILEYLNALNFTITRGDSRSIIIDFESDINVQQLKDLDSALTTFGFQRY